MGGSVAKERLHLTSPSYHCAMLGLDSSGKTTVLFRIKFGQYVNTAPTIGFNCEKIRTRPGAPTFTVWDVGGQERIRPLWRSYTRCADAVVFVVDSAADAERMEEARMELERILRRCPVPVLVVANKQDLPNAAAGNDLKEMLGLSKATEQCFVQPACAVTGEGLEEGFETLQDMISQSRRKRSFLAHSSTPTPPRAGRKVRRSHSHLY